MRTSNAECWQSYAYVCNTLKVWRDNTAAVEWACPPPPCFPMEASQNVAAVLYAAHDLRIEQKPVPVPQDADVLLAMGSVGICGSDVKYWAYGRCGRFSLTAPMVLGHEASGTVVAVGPSAKSLKVGDRVAIEPGLPCRRCSICKKGRYNLCTQMRFCATPPVDGSLCRYFVHPEDFCFKLPDHVTLDDGALLEPLAVAVYGCQRGDVGIGSSVLVCGAGPVGLLTLVTAKALGSTCVAVTDIDTSKLQLAKELGADRVIDVSGGGSCPRLTMDSAAAVADHIISELGGQRPDATLECSGADASISLGIHVTEPGGSVVLIGRGTLEPSLPIVKAATFEIDIKGVFRYANCYPRALSLIASGRIPTERLITHHYSLEESSEAFHTAHSPASGAVKIMIHCDKRQAAA